MIEKSIKTVQGEEIKIYCSYTELVDIEAVIENPRNPNKHPEKQIKMLAKIIKNQGWRSPIIISNRSGFVVKGHGRLFDTKNWDCKRDKKYEFSRGYGKSIER